MKKIRFIESSVIMKYATAPMNKFFALFRHNFQKDLATYSSQQSYKTNLTFVYWATLYMYLSVDPHFGMHYK